MMRGIPLVDDFEEHSGPRAHQDLLNLVVKLLNT